MNGYICRVITHPTYLFKASKIQPYEKKVVLQDPQEVGESCRIIGVGLNQPVGNLLKCGVYQQIPSETNQHSHGKCSMLMVSTGKDGGFSHGYVRLAEVIMSQMAPQLERFTPKNGDHCRLSNVVTRLDPREKVCHQQTLTVYKRSWSPERLEFDERFAKTSGGKNHDISMHFGQICGGNKTNDVKVQFFFLWT